MDRVTVLYLAGWGRSGSTIISGALDGWEGVTAVGEVRSLFGLGWGIGIRCSCDRPLQECPTWQTILERAYGSPPERQSMLTIARLQDRFSGIRSLGSVLTGPESPELEDYRDRLAKLYRAIGPVVVDSSKSPGYAAVLAGIPEIDLRLVHLIRDPRATAFSWQRTKIHPDFPDQREMTRYPAWKSTGLWLAWNLGIERLTTHGVPTMRLRYEDFARDPGGSLRALGHHGGLEPPDAVDVFLPTSNHMVHGNPGRRGEGRIVITEDDAWRSDLTTLDGGVATLLALPRLARYGYPIRWKRPVLPLPR